MSVTRAARRLSPLALAMGLLSLSCSGGDSGSTADTAETSASDVRFDTALPDSAAPDVDADVADTTPPLCATAGGFGCPCLGNADCLDGLCIEGPDGNVCTRQCVTECPENYDCLTTSVGGPDPVSLCVPRHTRLCRPCTASTECQNPLDSSPAACVPNPDPSIGSFCATSCAQVPCPTGYACEDVAVGEATARLCLKTEGECECRGSWGALVLMTTCEQVSADGACVGTRSCGPTGLSACSAEVPASEVCNLLDDDCDGTTDNIDGVACDNTNLEGTCSGVTACGPTGEPYCAAQVPGVELCNAIDDNCNSQTDEAWVDCLAAGCVESDGIFFETGAPSCVRGDCVYSNPSPCGLFTCASGGDSGDVCAAACADDSVCIAAAHCDESTNTCVPDIQDGSACVDQSDCGSGHCQNGFCCAEGDCCRQPADCPESFRVRARCDDATTCQGARRDALCVASMCGSSAPIADDSGCTVETTALDCSPNTPRFCTGTQSQNAPSCPSTCTTDAQCVEGYHCDGTCVPDVVDGGACNEGSDCVGGHCQNGFCCDSGDCCNVANDCPAAFRDPAMCIDGVTCQGERIDAVCAATKQCGSTIVQDDSGCDINVEANACGPYRTIYCSGAPQQSPPQCPFSCASDVACDNGFHCDTICLPDLPDGNFCDEDTDCRSDHCQNNICCSGGDCCVRAADCPASYTGVPDCDFPASCQGTKNAAVCTGFVCNTVVGAPDDSACTAAVTAKLGAIKPPVPKAINMKPSWLTVE